MSGLSDGNDDRIEIEFDEPEPCATGLQSGARPKGELVGAIPPDGVETYIDTRVMETTWQHVLSNRRTELGGVLVGYCAEDNGIFTTVTTSLDARHTTTTAGSLTFTHDTWADLADRMAGQQADAKIVGWYHSHPGHGVFMSGYDRFIHENFFRNAWQCALVLDPIRNDEGLFQSIGGRIVRTGYWCVPRRLARNLRQTSQPVVVEVESQELEPLKQAAEQVREDLNQVVSTIGRYLDMKA